MSYDLKQINPTKCQLSLNFGISDCYELRKGVCSLYLSEEDAERIKEEEDDIFHDGKVMFCRNLAKDLLDVNYFEDPNFQDDLDYSIKMHPRDCGHFVFSNGQHRTCIAKHLNISFMYVQMENYEIDDSILNCSACNDKERQEIKNKKIKNRIISMLNFIKEKEIPGDFIDQEYMNFKKESSFIK
ncbi:hypothetical protein [Priestia endophytica]|uniref:ParB/Sulfiredoxin domain-containing protein n=1 Tax=Priestia endophytica DSM 13796 TaxID=1121089 RepID=A0A1I6C034_9BACI|nr:hypothetical protein [Priestia endophytica]KYG33458.1 hypothetical protein AZF06_21680 [Priestia endophytica]SFQ86552.1 hypothetical protein SAMN02745910_04666 [Priestia endophytica DSM 13796]